LVSDKPNDQEVLLAVLDKLAAEGQRLRLGE
jgi:hypothetical protein